MSNTASYIGKEPTYGVFITQAETGDGSTVAFSLDATATTTQSLLVSVGGVVQQPSSAYNINSAGTTLTFTAAPGSGHVIWILFLGQTLVIPQAASANSTMITAESALGEVPAAGDQFLVYDTSAAILKKVAYSNLETGDIAGVTAGTGISGGGTSGTVTVSIDTAVTVDKTTAQTLTTKTLTSPILGGTTTTASGNLVVDPATSIVEVKGDGSSVDAQVLLKCHDNSHGQTLKSQPHSAGITNTSLLPIGGSSTLVSLVSTDTLTNKTLTSPTIGTSPTAAGATWADLGTVTTADINGGSVDGAIIGAASAAAGTFTAFTSTSIDDNGDAKNVNIDATEMWQWSTNGVFNAQVNAGTGGDKPWVFCHDDATAVVANNENMLVVSNGNDTTGNMSGIGFAWLDDDDHPHFAAATINCVFGARTSDQYPTGELAFSVSPAGGAPVEKMRLETDGTLNLQDNVLERPVIKDYGETVYAGGNTSTAVTLAETNGNTQTWTMTGNCTFTMPSGSGLQAGTSLTLICTQDGTGSRTATFTGVKWKDATAPVLTTTATTGIDIITFYTFNGGASPVWYGFLAGSAMG